MLLRSARQVSLVPWISGHGQLIVIFMILSIRPPAIHLQLPEPQDVGEERAVSGETLVLELDSLGGYRLNRQRLPVESLPATLHRAFDDRVWRVLYIRPASNRAYDDVIVAADVAKTAGVQVVGLLPHHGDTTNRRW